MNSMRRLRILFFLPAALLSAGTTLAGPPPGSSNVPSQSAAVSASAPQSFDGERKGRSFLLRGLDGQAHSLQDWKGKVIVLNFWATWCSPCLSEIRDFVAYQEKYKAQGLQIIGVGLDEERKLRNVQRTLEINFPILIADPVKDNALMRSWGNSGGIVPYSVVIGRDGRVARTHLGLITSETFNETILPLLSKS